MKIGLRVDVDTFRGTRAGVPNLCKIFADNCIRATFFFSVGPDNMGRHLWRLLRPAFLAKMLRSKAGKLYGWDILLRGTLWPGPVIGKKCGQIILAAAQAGHEIGLHAWDHHKWQAWIDKMDSSAIRAELKRAFEMISEITGAPPICSAVPGWKCTDDVLFEKQNFPFVYNSDCRGYSVFLPVVPSKRVNPNISRAPCNVRPLGFDVNDLRRSCSGLTLSASTGSASRAKSRDKPLQRSIETVNQPQVPVTLPTYDEVVGSGGITSASFGDYVLSQLRPDKLNVLTIHAEAEGIAVKDEFIEFIKKAKALGHEFCPLGSFVSGVDAIPAGIISAGTIPGREGWVSVQAEYGKRDSSAAASE